MPSLASFASTPVRKNARSTARALRLLVVLALAVAGTAAGLPACSPQGYGDRCDILASNGGTSDCSANLYCTLVASTATATGPIPVYACCYEQGQTQTGICELAPATKIDASVPPPQGSDAAVDGENDTDASDASDDTATLVDSGDASATDASDAASGG